jgi:phage shock protein E
MISNENSSIDENERTPETALKNEIVAVDKKINQKLNNMNIQKILKEKQVTIVDVRTPEEFRGGHVTGSINIPLNQIPQRLDEIKRMTQPLILCCASGGRSGQAHGFLAHQGIECANGGSWMAVQRLIA